MKKRKDKDKPKNIIKEKLYPSWLEFIFNNDTADAPLHSENFDATSEEIIELIRLTCAYSGKDLEGYSNQQIDTGLYHLFSSTDDYVFSFKESELHYTDIVLALQSIRHLYLDLFNDRCAPVLSYLDEQTDNPLNQICYMLWDITPLAYWPDDPNQKHYYAAIATVMEKALYLSNPACIESALHGLGHIQDAAQERVIQIIDTFLKKTGNKIRPELVTYAERARTGYIL